MTRLQTRDGERDWMEPGHGESSDGTRFFPDFALLEALTAFAFLVGLFVLASVTSPPLEPVADPNASGYVPRPEWYFLWYFQLLKYFKGELEYIGTFVLPTILVLLILSLPFLDRRRVQGRPLLPRTRPVRLWPRMLGGSALLSLAVLTVVAMQAAAPVVDTGPKLTPVQQAGLALYDKMGCASCHVVSGAGGSRGPDLTHFASRPGATDRVLRHFAGIGSEPGSMMPGYQLAPEELRSLAEYLRSLK